MKPAITKKTSNAIQTHRQMIAELYYNLGKSLFKLPEAHINYMLNIIENHMTDLDIKREWDFIKSGKAKLLAPILHQMRFKPDTFSGDQHKKVAELWNSVAKGLNKYRKEGMEIPDEDYKFMENAVMNLFDDLKESLPTSKKALKASILAKYNIVLLKK